MIKIIKRTAPNGYEWTCKKCKSIFQFQDSDCTESYDRTSCVLGIKCPVCGYPTDSTERWQLIYNEKNENTDESAPLHDYDPPRHHNGMPIL